MFFILYIVHVRLASDIGSGSATTQNKYYYRGTLSCIKETFRKEGMRGLYSGLASSLFGAIIFKSLFVGGYNNTKLLFQSEEVK